MPYIDGILSIFHSLWVLCVILIENPEHVFMNFYEICQIKYTEGYQIVLSGGNNVQWP